MYFHIVTSEKEQVAMRKNTRKYLILLGESWKLSVDLTFKPK